MGAGFAPIGLFCGLMVVIRVRLTFHVRSEPQSPIKK
jgi:hypothetical protein